MNPNRSSILALLVAAALACVSAGAAPAQATRQPLVRVVDLDRGESAEVVLADGSKARVKLLDVQETRDPVRDAVRAAQVTVEVNGKSTTLQVGNYHLPVAFAGVQIDCSITKGYASNSGGDPWGLDKAARLRLWPAGSPWAEPGTFLYPVRQRWFASGTQFANEPTFVDGGERASSRTIYYHNDLDFGGAEGMVEVVAATDALVVTAAGKTLPGYENTPARPRYDVVYLLDERGWYYRNSHFLSIDVKPGDRVRMGQKLGVLGKEGGSGGWSHLHFGIVCRQPSGKWGTQEAYAFAWEAYVREQKPALLAVARPHHLVFTGDSVLLDGSKSWAADGQVLRYEWTFTDGTKAMGARVKRTYPSPGHFSEVLQVTDSRGNVAYDFGVVQVLNRAQPEQVPPSIQAAYAPSLEVKAGQNITFQTRTFRTVHGGERWDFGDGTPPVTVKSDGAVKTLAKDGFAITEHRFAKPGDYIVRVERANERGEPAIAHLWVPVLAAAPPERRAAEATGPLRVHPTNPRYFADASGKAVYLTGSHVWNTLQDTGVAQPPPAFDFDGYLDFLTRHGHNFIRLWRFEITEWKDWTEKEPPLRFTAQHPWQRTGPGTALDGLPKFDFTRWNDEHFERLRTRVSAAGKRGIYVSVMLFEGWCLRVRPSAWTGHPMNAANNINDIDGDPNGDGRGLEVQMSAVPAITALQHAYIRKVVDTVNDLDNVLYEISNESLYTPEILKWQEQMIAYIKACEAKKPQQHPVGITNLIAYGNGKPKEAANDALFVTAADWVSPGATIFSAADPFSSNPPATTGNKVVILDTDHTWNNPCIPKLGPHRADHAWVWKSFLRGYNPIYMDPLDLTAMPDRVLAYAKTSTPAVALARPAMGHTLAYAKKINLAAMTPRDDLASSTYCLANPGKEYLVYLPEGGAVTVDLSAAKGPLAAEWFNPRNGDKQAGDPADGGGKRSFQAPFAGDAVLSLRGGRP